MLLVWDHAIIESVSYIFANWVVRLTRSRAKLDTAMEVSVINY